MADLPPAGSPRLTFAIVFWALFSIVFVGMFTYRAIFWLRGDEFPLLASIGGILGVIGIWRWIVAARREQHAGSPVEPPSRP